ncbi:ATP-grasp domain-containing protein [Micromonospora sp. NPDC047548]|uniref:ATP-grasp domain-containing protein n=1 Tax=Micromonospora sp. NPDC047548 TaxID=3155624 RepID=UPI0033C2C24B
MSPRQAIRPEAAWRVASRSRQLRGDDYAGGFVLRRFESFVGAEVRTWWVDGSCRLVTAHPDTPEHQPPAELDLTAVEASVPIASSSARIALAWRNTAAPTNGVSLCRPCCLA